MATNQKLNNMKYYYDNMELGFNKVTSKQIAKAVAVLQGTDHIEPEYVSWNKLGNYIMWGDGGDTTFYFCKKYLRVNGWDFTTEGRRKQAFEILKN